ncbi:MAG TPA: lipocalin family protein [Salinimicrobium sp.]|nr:lipocalin family protein [Salinimicrobium sp.]
MKKNKIIYALILCFTTLLFSCSKDDNSTDDGGTDDGGNPDEVLNIIGQWNFHKTQEIYMGEGTLVDYEHSAPDLCGMDHMAFSDDSTMQDVYYYLGGDDQCYEDVSTYDWNLEGTTLNINYNVYEVLELTDTTLKIRTGDDQNGVLLVLKKA